LIVSGTTGSLLTNYPNSNNMRNEFLRYFNATNSPPQESFESYDTSVAYYGMEEFQFKFSGLSFSNGNINGVEVGCCFFIRDQPNQGGDRFATDGNKFLEFQGSEGIGLNSVRVSFFDRQPQPVVGVSFVLVGVSAKIKLLIFQDFLLPAITIPIPHNFSGEDKGVVFIGYINTDSFKSIVLNSYDGDDYAAFTNGFAFDHLDAFTIGDLVL
jgi:hypothetical protein